MKFCFINLHTWWLIRDTGTHKHYECLDCGKRKVDKVFLCVHKPVDGEWLNK